jgi:CBS domain-containing protein
MLNASVEQILAYKGGEVHTVGLQEPILDAVKRMNECHIGSLVVTDGDRVVGIFTERDVLVRVVAAHRDPADTRISDVMTPQLVSISPATTVRAAMRVVTDTRCRHLPVMVGGRLVGLISSGDLSQWVLNDQRRHIDELQDYICRG